MHSTIDLDEFEDEWPWPTFYILFQVTMQYLVSVMTSDFLHRFTHNLNLGVPTWMTLTYIWPTWSQWMEIVPDPTCCKLHAHNYTCIPKNVGQRGSLDPSGQLVEYCFYEEYCLLSIFIWFVSRIYTCISPIISILYFVGISHNKYNCVYILMPWHSCVPNQLTNASYQIHLTLYHSYMYIIKVPV